MVLAKLLKSETITDDTRGGIKYEVFDIEVRLGMKRWVIKRKYEAFCQLDKILRANFEAQCTRAGILGLPKDASGKETLFVKEFVEAVVNSNELLETSPIRQFFEVPASRSLFDLSNDPSRSIFSATLVTIFKGLPPSVPVHVTLSDVIMLSSVGISALPVLVGIPIELQPFLASWVLVVCIWYFTQKEGVFDFILEKMWGHELVPYARSMIRPADMPGAWMFVGVLVGFTLGGHRHAGPLYSFGLLLARLSILLALMNFAFISGVATGKIKIS